METSELAKELTEVYLHEETYYEEGKKLSREEADAHHERALREGRIITISDGLRLAGYVEFRLEHGVCFIVDLFVRPAYRNKRVIWMLKRRLMEVTKGARVYLGERNKLGSRYPETQLRRV